VTPTLDSLAAYRQESRRLLQRNQFFVETAWCDQIRLSRQKIRESVNELL
jgi:hypothetical protein